MTLLLDHDNIPFSRIRLQTIIEAWITEIEPSLEGLLVGQMKVRAYGGWFDGEVATAARYAAAVLYQRTCPAVLSYRGRMCRLSFEFADELAIRSPRTEPVRVTHTVATRPAPQYVRTRKGIERCTEKDCQVSGVKRWLSRRRACTRTACPHTFSEYFERLEQKQVDVHLAIDTVLIAESAANDEHVAVASDDWDFLPSLAVAALKAEKAASLASIRFRGDQTYLDDMLESMGVRIVRIRED